MTKNRPVFRAIFTEAYSLRNLVTILNKKIDKANLIIKPEGIQICQYDNRQTMLIYAEIAASELIHYYYRSDPQSDELDENIEEGISLGINTSDFIRALKTLKKKDGAKIEFLGGTDRYIYIYTLNSSNKGCDSGCGKIRIIDIEDSELDIPEYDSPYPTVKEEGTEFASLCSALISHKCHYVVANCYKNRIDFAGYSSEKVPVYTKQFGKTYQDEIDNDDEEEEEEAYRINIPIDNFKCLQKINNLSSNSSIIKFFSSPNKPIRISTSIGGYGVFSVYLKNVDSRSSYN